MKKTLKTNAIILFFGYMSVILFVLTALGIHSASPLLGENNIFKQILLLINLQIVEVDYKAFIVLGLFVLLTFAIICLVVYEIKVSKVKTKKDKVLYSILFVVAYILVLSTLIFSIYMSDKEGLVPALMFLGEVLLETLMIILAIALVLMPVFILLHTNKDSDLDVKRQKALEDANLLVKEVVFPSLCQIDDKEYSEKVFSDDVNLKDFAEQFRLYLAKKEKLYFDINTIRTFIAGLSASRLIILEGLSGTGKSSIARYFSDFIKEESYFEAVQATWRDRNALLGFYNDFSKTYNETDFLKRLYEATYKPNDINIMVLDEMNISRIEYYFADFLSIMEYPMEDWKVKIMQLPYNFVAPNHLENGDLKIADTTWFIGTANKDDSTYTITDKVYDRAITINFTECNEIFEVDEDVHNVSISYNKLINLFDEAKSNQDNILSIEELTKFKLITDYTFENLEVTFGNRIYNQIIDFTPVFVACGGTKEDALDFMLAHKVLSKLEGRYEDYIKKGLLGLNKLLNEVYTEDNFKQSHAVIEKLLRRF